MILTFPKRPPTYYSERWQKPDLTMNDICMQQETLQCGIGKRRNAILGPAIFYGVVLVDLAISIAVIHAIARYFHV